MIWGESISIHAPHTGRDTPLWLTVLGLSTISIHAPHTGRDNAPNGHTAATGDFNPRAPYGARPLQVDSFRIVNLFQSTRPIRGATFFRAFCVLVKQISIHAPHTGRDRAGHR